MSGRITARLAELGVVLPTPPKPVANYLPAVVSGQQVYVSGQIPLTDGKLVVGVVGETLSVEQGQSAAKQCAVNVLAQVQSVVDLDRVTRCVRLGVFVNAAPGFAQTPEVANGASDFLVAVFGEAGRHTRSAVGAGSLPRGAAVEVEAIFDIA